MVFSRGGVFAFLIGILILLSNHSVHSREYSGYLRVNLKLTDLTEYNILNNFKMDDSKPLEVQFLKTVRNEFTTSDDYVFEFTLTSEIHDVFDAVISVHKKSYSKVDNSFFYRKTLETQLTGRLNFDNKFSISSATEPDLFIKLKIDKKFTLQEIKERFEQKIK